jgi:hypothetical protein
MRVMKRAAPRSCRGHAGDTGTRPAEIGRQEADSKRAGQQLTITIGRIGCQPVRPIPATGGPIGGP